MRQGSRHGRIPCFAEWPLHGSAQSPCPQNPGTRPKRMGRMQGSAPESPSSNMQIRRPHDPVYYPNPAAGPAEAAPGYAGMWCFARTPSGMICASRGGHRLSALFVHCTKGASGIMGKRLVSRARSLHFRQFRPFQTATWRAECSPGRPVSAREWLAIIANAAREERTRSGHGSVVRLGDSTDGSADPGAFVGTNPARLPRRTYGPPVSGWRVIQEQLGNFHRAWVTPF